MYVIFINDDIGIINEYKAHKGVRNKFVAD